VLQEQNVQSLYDDLLKVFRWYINYYIPAKFVRMSQRYPKFIIPLIHNLLRRRNRLLHKGKVDKAGELSVKVGKLTAVERAKLLSPVDTHGTKELCSSTGRSRSNNVVKSVFNLGPSFDDINAMNQFFAYVAIDPDFDLKQILSHIKQSNDQCEYYCSKFEVYRALPITALPLNQAPSSLRPDCKVSIQNACQQFSANMLMTSQL
jgi:hypothetical protein